MTAAVAWPEVAARATAFLDSVIGPLRATTLEMIDDGGIMLVAIGLLGAGVLFADIVATFTRGGRQIRADNQRRWGARKDRAPAATTPPNSAGRAIAEAGVEPARAADGSQEAAADLIDHTAVPARTALKPAVPRTHSRAAVRSDERAVYRWLSPTPRLRKRRRFGVDEAA